MVKGVILDIDGTLVLSNDSQAHAWVEAFAAYGHPIQYSQVRSLIGMGGDQLIPQLMPHLSAQTGEGKEIAEERKRIIINHYGPTLVPAPGARDLVLKLLAEQFKLIIATSATQEELKVLLKAAQVEDLLTESTTKEDAERSKPSPDIVQTALARLQLPSEQVVMLGDSPYDIQAAHAVGIPIIALRCGGFSDQQLRGAIELTDPHQLPIYNDPADLLHHYLGSLLTQ